MKRCASWRAEAFAGSHFNAARGELVVAVTDSGAAETVRYCGADAVLVANDERELVVA